MEEARVGQQGLRRSATIWSWWFTVVLVFSLESFIIYRLLNSEASPVEMARFLLDARPELALCGRAAHPAAVA